MPIRPRVALHQSPGGEKYRGHLVSGYAPRKDTNNNPFDFFLQTTPTPMNSSSMAPAFYNSSLQIEGEEKCVNTTIYVVLLPVAVPECSLTGYLILTGH